MHRAQTQLCFFCSLIAAAQHQTLFRYIAQFNMQIDRRINKPREVRILPENVFIV